MYHFGGAKVKHFIHIKNNFFIFFYIFFGSDEIQNEPNKSFCFQSL